MTASPSRIQVLEIGHVTVVRLVDAEFIESSIIQEAGVELFNLVDALGRRNLLLDLANVVYLSSAALGKLITLNRKATAAGGHLVLCNLHADVRDVLKLSKLDRLLDIREWNAEDDPAAELGGVWSKLPPNKPAGEATAASRPPPDAR
jgi:anti-sigma B factor antagonist